MFACLKDCGISNNYCCNNVCFSSNNEGRFQLSFYYKNNNHEKKGPKSNLDHFSANFNWKNDEK